jgi:hypothetical protein
MYNNNSGAYSNMGENIVHEAINLLQSDDGNNYIYIVPRGTVANNKNVQAVLLVRKAPQPKTVEVIAKATGLHCDDFEDYKNDKNQEEWAKAIKYGGVSLFDHMESNVDITGEYDDWKIYATYRADKVCRVKEGKHIYVTNDDKYNSSDDNNIYVYIPEKTAENNDGYKILNQSQKLYIPEESKKIYKKIDDIIVREDLWSEPIKDKLEAFEEKDEELAFNNCFIEVLGQQYNELAYSNMFAYIFTKYREEFSNFCKNILDGIKLSSEYIVEREYKNIDIMVDDENYTIVIENKIHSGINGINGSTSQLSKYYNIVNSSEENNRFENKEKKFYIFAPEYEIHYIDRTKEPLENGTEYNVISYKTIYDFFKKNEDKYTDDSYYLEFLKALSRHTRPVDNQVEYQMIKRMLKNRNAEL